MTEIKIKTRTLSKHGPVAFALRLPPEWVEDLAMEEAEKIAIYEDGEARLVLQKASLCTLENLSDLHGIYPLQKKSSYPQVTIPVEWVRSCKIDPDDPLDIYRDEGDRLILAVKKETSIEAER